MAGVIRRRNRIGIGQLEGIRKLKFTVGEDESGLFLRQNQVLIDKGLPYYRRIDKSIGFDGATFMWIEPTLEAVDHITHLELSHVNYDHPSNKSLAGYGYVPVGHPNLKLVIWTKTDPKAEKIIREIIVAYSTKEEMKLAADGCIRCIENLSEFGFPDGTLWLRKSDREEVPMTRNTAALTYELEELRIMKAEKPNDEKILELENKLINKLRDAYEMELAAEVTDPVKYAVDLMALDELELQKWMRVYEKIDTSKRGKVTLEQIFTFFDDYPITDIHKEVFESLDSVDEEGLVEFGDFLRSCAVFCMFGQEELLRWLHRPTWSGGNTVSGWGMVGLSLREQSRVLIEYVKLTEGGRGEGRSIIVL